MRNYKNAPQYYQLHKIFLILYLKSKKFLTKKQINFLFYNNIKISLFSHHQPINYPLNIFQNQLCYKTEEIDKFFLQNINKKFINCSISTNQPTKIFSKITNVIITEEICKGKRGEKKDIKKYVKTSIQVQINVEVINFNFSSQNLNIIKQDNHNY
eukprot:TRINITY_DN27394_c0_g2_i1.p2 TRINITY_DN27394_c0_g2~~TRINITY_DN27394_c0_g2_i1.p2  ORF type:complete len:156 (-),score=7.23 TRINITY_DN27394_c0_g2_i1:245-712(-)